MEERFEVIEEVKEEKKNVFVRVKEGIAAKKEEFEENHPKVSRAIKIAIPVTVGAVIALATKKNLDNLKNDPDMVYIDLDADEESVPVYDDLGDDGSSAEEKSE